MVASKLPAWGCEDIFDGLLLPPVYIQTERADAVHALADKIKTAYPAFLPGRGKKFDIVGGRHPAQQNSLVPFNGAIPTDSGADAAIHA